MLEYLENIIWMHDCVLTEKIIVECDICVCVRLCVLNVDHVCTHFFAVFKTNSVEFRHVE